MAIYDYSMMLGPIHIYAGTSYPVAADGGTYNIGDVVVNTAPANAVPSYWVCSVASTALAPAGTWVKTANLATV